MNGKLDCQLVIQMIGRTWDRQFATYSSQPDGPSKEGPADIHYIYIYISTYFCYLKLHFLRLLEHVDAGFGRL